jgi:hypothetical protein
MTKRKADGAETSKRFIEHLREGTRAEPANQRLAREQARVSERKRRQAADRLRRDKP